MNPRVLYNTAAFVACGYMGFVLVTGYLKVKHAEKAKREQLKKSVEREQILIHRANAVVLERIRTGKLAGKNLDEIVELQKFEQMEQNLQLSNWDFS